MSFRRPSCCMFCPMRAPKLPGNLCPPDGVDSYDRPVLSDDCVSIPYAPRWLTAPFCVYLGVARLQDGAGAVLCRQATSSAARTLRISRALWTATLRRVVHPGASACAGSTYIGVGPADPRMAAVLLRCGFLCGARRRNRRVDIGMQCIRLRIRPLCFETRSLRNFRTDQHDLYEPYFAGGSLGTLLSGALGRLYGGRVVVAAGICFSSASLLVTLCTKKLVVRSPAREVCLRWSFRITA